jgi:hypothetical protein
MGTQIGANGVTFPDGTVQPTAAQTNYLVEALVLAGGGGGGGGSSGWRGGGGGGAGGLIIGSTTVSPGQSLSVIVGAGGAGQAPGVNGLNGGNSVFGGWTAYGGGGGGGTGGNGSNGGSGGGGGDSSGTTYGGSGTSGQGYAGGASGGSGTNGSSGASGGGYTGVGIDNDLTQPQSNGYTTAFRNPDSGATEYIAAGGASGQRGGANMTPIPPANSGHGGPGAGGLSSKYGDSGGSGMVVLKYLGPQRGTGGVVSSKGPYTIHTFTTSGTFTFAA